MRRLHSIDRSSWRAAVRTLRAALAIIPLCLTHSPARAQIYRPLYSFTGGTDGSGSNAGLLRDKEGNLYGTTHGDGRDFNYGSVFELTP